MKNKATALLVFIVLVVVVYSLFIFIVREDQTALKLRLGEVAKADYEPGFYFKIPLVNDILIFDRRIQTTDSNPEEFLTVEKKFVVVDSFVEWKLVDVERFYRATRGEISRASSLLSQRVNTALRDAFAQRTVTEVISGERSEIMKSITEKTRKEARDLGIEVVDVRVKKIDFPPNLSKDIFRRMRSERERIAKELRAEGREEEEKLRAEADRQKIEIESIAYTTAEKTRGEGDAISAETYAQAFNRDSEFYAFWRSLTAYEKVFDQGGDVMVLNPDSEFFQYLKQKQGQ